MKRILLITFGALFSIQVLGAEVSLICEYGEKEETRLLRFDEDAGTLRYKGETWIDRARRNERTDDGWNIPIQVVFAETEIKATFYTCTFVNGFGMYSGCRTKQVYTLDRTAGTLTSEATKRFGPDLDAIILQCRVAKNKPMF